MSEEKLQNVPEQQTPPANAPRPLGRNEPCPCGSRKKYKRCCGVDAAPRLSSPDLSSENSTGTSQPFLDPSALSNLDPQMMMQISQAMQKLPKGQLQRLQAIMQKAMNGKDVALEAQELERTLPKDFQETIQSLSASYGPDMLQKLQQQNEVTTEPPSEAESQAMTEEQARALVAQAAAEGTISKEEADSLLKGTK